MKFLSKKTIFLILILVFLADAVFAFSIPLDVEKRNQDYRDTVIYYNPKLSPKTVRDIVSTIIYYCYVYQLDPRLVMAVIKVESNFRPSAKSPAGALGLGQIMPENARALGITEPFEPVQNIKATIRFIKLNYDRFKHQPYQQRIINALAAYNAGYGAVLKHGGIPPYPETQNYVYMVIKLWRKFSGLKS